MMSNKRNSEKCRRIVMTVAGVSASGVAVGFFNYSAFGMDPFVDPHVQSKKAFVGGKQVFAKEE